MKVLALPASTIRRSLTAVASLALVALASAPASAHFSWVVPTRTGVRLLLSETPRFDGNVDAAILTPARLWFKAAQGEAQPLTLRKPFNEWVAETGGRGTVYGTIDLGLTRRGEVPHVLLYYPKAIAGDPFGADAHSVGAPVELFLAGTAGAARLKLVADGKPVPNAEVSIIAPDETEKKVRTDADGLTDVLPGPGRYGAWARHWVETPGERDGVAYKQVRRYATLVFDLREEKSAAAPPVAVTGHLPQAASSFGAATADGWLYVYGGHVAATHQYSRESVSGAFHRLKLSGGTWETLPAGTTVQGMNLATHKDRIYRIGGMRPENAPDQPSDTRSLAEAAGFDPATKTWEALPDLPAPRSSHEVALVGDELLVIGGWNMRGKDEPAAWADSMVVMDVRAKPLRWEEAPQPFQRRAFGTSVRGSLVYVIGGMDPEGRILSDVDVYDTTTRTWSKGPSLPEGPRNGFSPAACTLDNRVYVSLGDGGLYVLDEVKGSWDRIATTTPRVAHRMVPGLGDQLLLLGGAGKTPVDLIETIDVSPRAQAAAK